MTAVITAIAILLGSAFALVLCWAALLWLVMRYAGKKLDVDRYEDREQSDRDVQQIVDSMKGTL